MFLILSYPLISYSSSTEQWSESIKNNWDKSKQYSQEGWDETKKFWQSAEDMLGGEESEEERKQARLDKEDERFREIWGTTFSELEDGLVIVDDINKAPAYAFFGDDKKSLKKELDKILEKTIVLLEDVSINEYRAKIEEYTNKMNNFYIN